MDLRGLIDRQKIMEAFRNLSKLRIPTSRSTLLAISALTLIVFLAFSIRLLPMRWGLELSEFDPYFQYQFTEKIVQDGYFDWLSWTTSEAKRWYPLERNVGRAAFPGLPMTAATLYNVLSTLAVPISSYEFAVLFPAIFGALACLAVYFFAKDVGGQTVGLLSALFLALNASHITRTSAGFFDDETVGIGAIILFSFLFLRSIDLERPRKHAAAYALAAGLTLGYITASWGAAFYPIAMTTLFVFALILIRRYSRRLLISYSLTFGLGLFLAINVPKNSPAYLSSMAILPVLGVFAILCLHELTNAVSTRRTKIVLVLAFFAAIIGGLIVLSALGYAGSITGKFLRVLNPTTRGESQIYQSVQEHRLTAWGSFFYDYGIGVFFFPLGLFFAVRNLRNRDLFLLIFGLTALYFASSMVRLTILLAPAFCVLMAVGLVNLLKPFVAIVKEAPQIQSGRKHVARHVGREFGGAAIILIFILLMLTYAFPSPIMYNHAYSPPTILSASLPLRPTEPIQDWVEMLQWVNLNLPDKAIICSWWDYGYWITIRGNRTTLADNATFNSTHIGQIGLTFMSNETESVRILKEGFNGPDGPPTHILVFTTFDTSGNDVRFGDEGKWNWMARIANQTVAPGFYIEWEERDTQGDLVQFNTFGNASRDRGWVWNDLGEKTTIYKLMQFAKASKIPALQAPSLNYFDVAHFSPGAPYQGIHALVCLYEIDYDQYELDNPSP